MGGLPVPVVETFRRALGEEESGAAKAVGEAEGLGDAEPENRGKNADRMIIHARKRDLGALPSMPAKNPAKPVSMPIEIQPLTILAIPA